MKARGFTTHSSAPTVSAPLAGGRLESIEPGSLERPPEPGGALQWLLEGRGWRWVRPIIDLLAVYAAAAICIMLTDAQHMDRGPVLLLPLFVVGIFFTRGFYRQRMRTLVLDGLVPTVGTVSIAGMVVAVTEFYTDNRVMSGGALVRLWGVTIAAVCVGRALVALVQRLARANLVVGKPTLILGAGFVGAQVARRLETAPEYGMRPIGYIDAEPLEDSELDARGLPVLGGPDRLEEIAAQTGARQVIVAFSSTSDEELLPIIRRAEKAGLGISVVPRLYESLNGQMAYDVLGGMPLLALHGVDPLGASFTLKHAFDRVASALLLLLLAPLMILLVLAVKLTSPGPVLFRQSRVGRGGRAFDLYKFRSMRGSAGSFEPAHDRAPGGVEGTDRRTSIGRLMRRTSLDELPQLLNVLRGEMSLVGPRPERPEYVELFAREIPRYHDRHSVRPGITGWAQVHGLRGQTSLRDRVEWDNYYIAHWSMALDLKVFLLTLTALWAPE